MEEKSFPILGAFMVPHPPIILPEVGRGEEKKIRATTDAYEAVADAECKIINGEKRQVVRTGHTDGIGEEYIDPDDETSSLAIKVLDKKIGIYQFYFDNGEGLRELIDK